jgi:ATP-dependent DNA helicase RecG
VPAAALRSLIEPAKPAMILLTRTSLAAKRRRLGEDKGVLLDDTPLERLLGERTARAFQKQLGFKSAGELLGHFPRRYSKRGELTDLSAVPLGEMVTIVAEVVSATDRRMRGRSGSLLEVVVTDGTGELTLAFFNQAWRKKDLHRGVRGLFSGKIGSFRNRLQLAHPDYELFDTEIATDQAQAWAQLPIPIYRATSSLPTWKIQKSVQVVLAGAKITELLPNDLLSERGLVSLAEAIRGVHQPEVDSDWQAARESLKFHEAMLLQLEILRRRAEFGASVAKVRTPGALLSDFDAGLPFGLTAGQIMVGQQIETDLAAGHPMHRMLQGEVGSGKTLVAVRALLTAAESGGQTALLAPTEVLATQHYESIRATLGDELTKKLAVRLLTGQLGATERKRVLLDLVSGKSLLVIGTHALLSEGVEFADLALVIIDEQHRFGVGQREALRAKAKTPPHTLVMTATPIPRTLAITVFGDLEVSTLRELPAGRQQIATHVVGADDSKLVARVWQRVAEEISNGRQVFVVCPRIEGDDYETEVVAAEPSARADVDELREGEQGELDLEPANPPAAAVEISAALAENPLLAGVNIGLLHGRLASSEKQQVMAAFSSGEIQLLVATTVIEVGVNVPNASVMVVLDADRFGLSQLHQLRGRVGRGEHPGLCLLLTGSAPETLAGHRLAALATTTDGFELSEIDLELRGEGDVLSDLQSGGRSSLQLLRVVRDKELIVEARAEAEKLVLQGLPGALQQALERYQLAAITRG